MRVQEAFLLFSNLDSVRRTSREMVSRSSIFGVDEYVRVFLAFCWYSLWNHGQAYVSVTCSLEMIVVL